MCLKESCFLDCWKVSSVVPVFKNAGKRSTSKNYRPVGLLSVVSKIYENLRINLRINKLADYLEKYDLFGDFQYGFSSFRSTAYLQTIVSTRIARAFDMSGATQTVALTYPRLSTGFDMLVLFKNSNLMEIRPGICAYFVVSQ